ncbi:hypothetical protein BVX93_02280, partial [bacterium B13(2017)]
MDHLFKNTNKKKARYVALIKKMNQQTWRKRFGWRFKAFFLPESKIKSFKFNIFQRLKLGFLGKDRVIKELQQMYQDDLDDLLPFMEKPVNSLVTGIYEVANKNWEEQKDRQAQEIIEEHGLAKIVSEFLGFKGEHSESEMESQFELSAQKTEKKIKEEAIAREKSFKNRIERGVSDLWSKITSFRKDVFPVGEGKSYFGQKGFASRKTKEAEVKDQAARAGETSEMVSPKESPIAEKLKKQDPKDEFMQITDINGMVVDETGKQQGKIQVEEKRYLREHRTDQLSKEERGNIRVLRTSRMGEEEGIGAVLCGLSDSNIIDSEGTSIITIDYNLNAVAKDDEAERKDTREFFAENKDLIGEDETDKCVLRIKGKEGIQVIVMSKEELSSMIDEFRSFADNYGAESAVTFFNNRFRKGETKRELPPEYSQLEGMMGDMPGEKNDGHIVDLGNNNYALIAKSFDGQTDVIRTLELSSTDAESIRKNAQKMRWTKAGGLLVGKDEDVFMSEEDNFSGIAINSKIYTEDVSKINGIVNDVVILPE